MGGDDEGARARDESALKNIEGMLKARLQAEGDLLAAETSLRKSEERMRAVFDQVPVGIAVIGLHTFIEQANRRFVEILGYLLEELRHLSFSDFTHPDDLAITREHVERLRDGHGKGYTLEKRYIRKDGGVMWSRTAVEILRDAQRKPYQYVGIIEDITSRKRAEEELLTRSQRLRLALEAGKLSDWSWDIRTDVVTMAPQMKALYELPPDRVVKADDLRPLLEMEDAAETRAQASRAMAERTPFSLEYRINPPSGKQAWVAVRGQGEYGSTSGALTGMVGVLQNITQEKEVERALRETDQRKDEFLATLAHELRNPLAPIRACFTYAPNRACFTYALRIAVASTMASSA